MGDEEICIDDGEIIIDRRPSSNPKWIAVTPVAAYRKMASETATGSNPSIVSSPDVMSVVSAHYKRLCQVAMGDRGATLVISHTLKHVFIDSSVNGSKSIYARLNDGTGIGHFSGFKGKKSGLFHMKDCDKVIVVNPGQVFASEKNKPEIAQWSHVLLEANLPTSGGDEITCMCGSPNKTTLVVGYSSGCLNAWDVVTGALLATFIVRTGILCVAFSSDGEYLVICIAGEIMYFRMATGMHEDVIYQTVYNVISFRSDLIRDTTTFVQFTRRDSQLVVGTSCGIVQIWCTQTNQLIESWPNLHIVNMFDMRYDNNRSYSGILVECLDAHEAGKLAIINTDTWERDPILHIADQVVYLDDVDPFKVWKIKIRYQ